MFFEFDSDQRMWQDYVRKVVAKECPPSLVRAIVDQAGGPASPGRAAGGGGAAAAREGAAAGGGGAAQAAGGGAAGGLWRTYVELGWTELFGAGETIELAVVLEELGRATDPTPYLATMTQFAPLAPGVLNGGEAGAAVLEGVTANPDDAGGWVLEGGARGVLEGDRADRLAVVTGAGVFVVPAQNLERTRTSALDPGLHLAEVSLTGVRVTRADRTAADPAKARHLALTGMALTMVGACSRVLDLTLEHVRNREQFGAKIGSFQAVQHKAADMCVAVERARALAYFAALTIAADDPRRSRAALMAKAAAGECQSLVFRNGLQLFGGMGMTWENDLQLALKRAKAGELMLGGAAEHRAALTDLYLAEETLCS